MSFSLIKNWSRRDQSWNSFSIPRRNESYGRYIQRTLLWPEERRWAANDEGFVLALMVFDTFEIDIDIAVSTDDEQTD